MQKMKLLMIIVSMSTISSLMSMEEEYPKIYSFNDLIAHDARILRNLVEKGNKEYVPELFVAEGTINAHLQSLEQYEQFMQLAPQHTFDFVNLISNRRCERHRLLWDIDDEDSKGIASILERNPYVLHAYNIFEDQITQHAIFPQKYLGKFTPLHYVFFKLKYYNNQRETQFLMQCARQLLQAGANPSVMDSAKNSPLHLASTVEQVKLLLEFGAQPDLPNYRGQTPLDVAKTGGVATYLHNITKTKDLT